MPTIQDFEAALNEIVQAKRLSQSKMLKLTEITMHLMEQDTQLVSTLYRTHKSLPATCKISSLYVFDALARAARQHVVKHNISERQATGNCATFLSKVAGVLEGLFQDMLVTGLPEAKEKTKRIYDIWVKGSTFPPAILSRLLDILSGKDKVSDVNTNALVVSSDPRLPPPTPTAVTIPSPATPGDPQSTLLALLTQAASQKVPQTNVNTPSPALDSAQLAVLQYLQLASTNNAAIPQISPAGPNHALMPDTHVSQTVADPRIYTSRDKSIFPRHAERHDNYRSPPQNDRYHDRDHDSRDHFRNDPKGNPRRRGRWNRWDDQGRDRDRYRERRRERDQSPSSLKVPSRSRSPSNRNRRRDFLPHSPPQRNSQLPSTGFNDGNSPKQPSAIGSNSATAGKDEFGRDLRPDSPPSVPPLTSASVITPTSNDVTNLLSSILSQEAKEVTSSTSTSNDPMSIPSSIAVNTSAKDHVSSDTTVQSESNESQNGLDSFDFTTFNPTLPESWEALGKMWQVTNGYLPSMEELMQFVMMGTMSQAMTSGAWEQQDVGDSQWMNGKEEGGRETAHSSDNYYGNGQNGKGKQGWNNKFHGLNDQESEAVVLGGTTEDDTGYGDENNHNPQQDSPNDNQSGGKMQRVGDKWVFVRNDGGV